MTESEIRHAIAEACGLSDVQEGPWSTWYAYKADGTAVSVPDYTRDLNAIHEACMTSIPSAKLMAYFWCLLGVMKQPSNLAMSDAAGIAIHATSSQRSEAFGRVMFPEKFKD